MFANVTASGSVRVGSMEETVDQSVDGKSSSSPRGGGWIILIGSGTFRAKTSSSRDGSRKIKFSNGTFPPGTVRACFKN